MPISIKKRKNESDGALISRFTKRVMQSGVIKEVKGRRYFKKDNNTLGQKNSALYQIKKTAEYDKKRKWGLV